MAWLGSGAGAAIEQWRLDPPEWGGGAAGFGRRYASVHGYLAAREAFAFALGAALREDPRYPRSRSTGFGARARDAVVNSLVVRTDGGRRTFNFALAGSQVGAGLLTNTWYPDGDNSVGDGLTRAGIGFGFAVFRNVVREFWPDVKRAVFRRRAGPDHSAAGSSVPSPARR